MLKLQSISVRIMIAISLVAAASCAGLAGFGLWQQNNAIDLALHRELQSDYANMIGAMDSDTRALQAVANTLADMPDLKLLIRAQDRAGIVALLDKTLNDIKRLGIELITIQIPPGITLARGPQPESLRRRRNRRRKMIVQAFATKKADRRHRSRSRRSQYLRRNSRPRRRHRARHGGRRRALRGNLRQRDEVPVRRRCRHSPDQRRQDPDSCIDHQERNRICGDPQARAGR